VPGLLVLIPAQMTAVTAATVPAKPFVVYDATLYHSKPDLTLHGIRSLKIIYVTEFGENWHNSSSARNGLPEESTVTRLAKQWSESERIVAIDIEHWPLTGDAVKVQESLAKYRQVAKWFHEAAPSMNIGFFGIVPMAAYGWSLGGEDSTEYRAWQEHNDRLIPLAEQVDVMFPHLYTYYPDQTAWVRYATENIKEARRYGRPVYVFLWHRYESGGGFGGQEIPPDYWELQLNTAYEHADGLVIWGGWGKHGPEPWDEAAPWWQATKRFMSRLDGVAPRAPSDLKAR
jgi:hypothetical protein